MKKIIVVIIFYLFAINAVYAQTTGNNSSLLWKVEGKELKKPSYLFGTYHLLTNSFVDTLEGVMKAYHSSDVMVGELIMDSTIQTPVLRASVLRATTLKELLPDTLYAKVSKWFTEEAGFDLARFDRLNPMFVMITALQLSHQKYHPNKPEEVLLDIHFQEQAKKDGKKLIGLETIAVQMNALYYQLSQARQVELLDEAFKDQESFTRMNSYMMKTYLANDLNELEKSKSVGGPSFTPEEWKVMLDDRNMNWVEKLPAMMKDESLFVAVGALHLAGKTGLVAQLRKLGYEVTALKLD